MTAIAEQGATNTISIETVINHPDFKDDTMSNDISIIKTAEKIDFEKIPGLQKIDLPKSSFQMPYGETAEVAGWGWIKVEYWVLLLVNELTYKIILRLSV